MFLEEVIRQYNLLLPRNSADWRAAPRTDGQLPRGAITGVISGVRLLCTDGVIGWFALGAEPLPSGEQTGECQTFLGHISHFIEEKPARSAGEQEDRGPRISKHLQKALENLGL